MVIANLDNDDDGLDLPVIQPKSFAPIPSPSSILISSSPKSLIDRRRGNRNNTLISEGGDGGGRYASSPKSSSSSPATPRTATKLGLSLRRITPSATTTTAAVATPSPSPRARRLRGTANNNDNSNNNYNYGDGQQSTTGSSSLVSRITGGGRSKYSIATGATPVMRGGGGRSRSHRGSGGNPPALKKKTVDQRQRMEDEYYRPSMHWEEEEFDEDDDDDDEEQYDHDDVDYYYHHGQDADAAVVMMDEEGEQLPRFMRVENNNNNNDVADSSKKEKPTTNDVEDMPPPLLVSPTNHEQLKVAGFWSQLDDNGSGNSSENEDEDDIDNVNDNDDDDDDDHDSEEEMPGDERQHWRQSVSPSPRNRKHNRNRFGLRDNHHDNDNSIGLDLVRPIHNGGGGEEEYYDGTARSKSLLQQPKSDKKKNGNGRNNWNLLDKAACFANDNKVVGSEEEEEDQGQNTAAGGGRQKNNNRNDYNMMEEEEDEDQSLDRTFQSSYTGTRTTAAATTNNMRDKDDTEEEENGVMACITGALATICGYEAAENLVSPNKKRAHDIIDKRKNSRSVSSKIISSDRDGYGNYYDDETNMTDEEDAAIELQYHHSENQVHGGDDSGGLALSPRRKLAFKKLLSLGKKNKKKGGMESPTRKTLVTTTTRSGKDPSGVGEIGVDGGEGLSKSKTRITDLNSSLTFEQEILGIVPGEDEEEEEEDVDEIIGSRTLSPRSPAMDHDEPKVNKIAAINDGDYAETYRSADKSFIAPPHVIPNDDEELESEAAAWSTNKKNLYLRHLAERAKMEYAVNAAGGPADSPSNDDKSNTGTAMSVAITAAAAAAAAVASSQSAHHYDNNVDEPVSISRQQDTGGEQASYNADYNTFNPAQKRLFLRLLNSGMSPQDAARRLAQESGGDGKKYSTTEDAVNVDDNGADEYEQREFAEEEDTIVDDDKRNANNDSDKPSLSKMPSLKYPDDESMPQLIPPLMSADVMSDTAEGNDELSVKNDNRDNVYSVSRSEMAQDESRSNSQGRHTALASIPLVPALIRAKLRSKSKERKTEFPTLLQQDDDDDGGDDAAAAAAATDDDDDDVLDELAENGQFKEAPASNNVGGLLSSGIGYYDAQGRGIDQNEEENELDDDNADSGLLIRESALSTRGKSQKQKFIGAAVASGLAAKVAASSRQVGAPRKRGPRYRSVDTSLSSPVTMAEYDSNGDADFGTDAHDVQETKPIKSPRPVSSTLNFMNRNSTKKAGSSKQWSKLDSDMDLDPVGPSQSVEVEDMPSWLVSRSDDEDVELKNEAEGEDKIDEEQIDVDGEAPDTFVHSTVAEQIESRPPLWSSEMDQSQMRNVVVTPSSAGSTTSVNSLPDELASEAGREESQRGEDAPFPPPVSPVSPDDDAISMMDRSFASSMVGSAWTSISKSHRKRHKGAASKRILQAKEAESQNKNKGWLDSIRDAASMHGQVWDPERGWVDYTEPEDNWGQEHDYSLPGSLHVVIPSQTRIKTEDVNDYGVDAEPRAIGQSMQVESGASVLRSPDGSRGEIKPSADISIDGDDTIFDSMTVNSAAEAMSVYSNSTAAPKRRAAPRHRPTDRRKIAVEHQDKKTIGWKESMENATANVAGRYWDYERGWVRADGTVDDDVSELTRSTLEGVKVTNQDSKSDSFSPVDSMENMAFLKTQRISRVVSGEESTSRSHLPPVTEETENAGSNLNDEDENDDDLIAIGREDHAATSKSIDPDDDLTTNIQLSEDIVLPSIATAGSDKENQMSSKEGSTDTPPLPSVDNPTQSLPLRNNPKRTLNQWLEKSNKDASLQLDESDVAAVMSHESTASTFSKHNEDDDHQPLPTPFPFSDIMDSFGEIENGAQEVEVVKEKCTDADSDLFEPSKNVFSTSLINKLSEGVSVSTRKKNTLGQPVHERKYESRSDFYDNPSRLPSLPPSSEGEHQHSAVVHDSPSVDALQVNELDSPRVRSVWAHPQQTSAVMEESSTTELDSNTPQVNTVGSPIHGENNASSSQKVSGIQNLDPPKSRSRIGTKNIKKASDSWILDRKGREKDEDEQMQCSAIESATTTNSYVGSLRSKFESKGSDKPVVMTNTSQMEKPVFVPTNNVAEENDVYFRSTAMGIRLKRGEDGFVRVVSVTEATNDSSIVRDGAIEPDDRVMEAAGVNLRNPISNNQWGETVTKIRNAPRPMKFVVAAGPKRNTSTESSAAHQPSSILPPPPAKYVMESRLSKSPEGQQVLESLSMARSYDVARAVTPPSIQQLVNSSSQTSRGGADETVASGTVNDDNETQIPPKESLLKRIAAGCASPATVCTAPTSHHPSASSQHSQGSSNEEGSQVPMAHLQFLRTNPTIARVANAASRRYPALCGRPDTIFEEPDDDDDVTRDTMTTERSAPRDRRSTNGSTRKRSSSSKDDTSQTMATYSTYDDRTTPPIGATYSTGSGSIGSGGTGDNTEFLEKLAIGSSLRSHQSNPRQDNDTTHLTLSQKMGKTSNGLSGHVACGYQHQQHVADDVEWPDDSNEQLEEDTTQKETIQDTMSSYSSSINRPSYLSSKQKNGTARQAELLAARKIENMMNELHNVDPGEECEI